MQPWAFVSPTSRGIGLEVARRLLRTTSLPVVATARKDLDQTKEKILTGLEGVKEDRLKVFKVDVLGMASRHYRCSYDLTDYTQMSPRSQMQHQNARSCFLRRSTTFTCLLP